MSSIAGWHYRENKGYAASSFSYAPERFQNKTVFRIGAGYYYGPGQTEDQIQPAANDRKRLGDLIAGTNVMCRTE